MFNLSKSRVFRSVNRSKPVGRAMTIALCMTFILACTISTAQAAIVGTGDVNPLDPNTWTSSTTGYVGESGTGTVTVDDQSVLLSAHCFLGSNAGSSGTATITGAGSKWTNKYNLFVGDYGVGTLNIKAGGQVSSSEAIIGRFSGHGDAMVTGAGSRWDTTYILAVGYFGSGTLTVANGGIVSAGSLHASPSDLYGNGTIYTHGVVLDTDVTFDKNHGLQQTFGFGSGGVLNLTYASSSDLGVGHKGTGTLRIADGVAMTSSRGIVGQFAGAHGTATVTGNGSAWNVGYLFAIGSEGNGVLNIEAGGKVSNTNKGYVGMSYSGTGTVTVTGDGSTWTNGNYLYVGYNGSGTINVENGGQVLGNYGCYIGYNNNTTGTATVSGANSKWIVNNDIVIGGNGQYSGSGTLNIGSASGTGGLVKSSGLLLFNNTQNPNSTATCNINNGGTLQTRDIRGTNTAQFNWNDGTIRNRDTSTDLTVYPGFALKLAATGSHAFYIDADRSGTVGAVLCDATSGGTLTKQGAGLLTLTGANTYSGDTNVEAGTLSIGNPYLNDAAGVHISSGAVLNLSFSGSDMVGSLFFDGTPAALGTWGSSLSSAAHIDDAHFSGSGMLNVVPEPSMVILVGMGVMVVLACVWWGGGSKERD